MIFVLIFGFLRWSSQHPNTRETGDSNVLTLDTSSCRQEKKLLHWHWFKESLELYMRRFPAYSSDLRKWWLEITLVPIFLHNVSHSDQGCPQIARGLWVSVYLELGDGHHGYSEYPPDLKVRLEQRSRGSPWSPVRSLPRCLDQCPVNMEEYGGTTVPWHNNIMVVFDFVCYR